MKTLLVAINAKYEHEGLAVWYLNAACKHNGISAKVLQYSKNDSAQKIWASLMEQQPDVIAFSCYIWNREQVLNLISDIKKAMPQMIVIVGGPEVSYEGAEIDFKRIGADFVIKGEGETIFPMLISALSEGGLSGGISFFEAGNRCKEEMGYLSPFVPEYLNRIKNRIAYIESSRGCPYKCSYCLSSESHGLTFFPLEAIKDDIESLVNAGAKVIKFIDRSFNVNESHSLEIWDFIKRYADRRITFHFEVNPDRLTIAQIESLVSMPSGLVQIEAGIQSTNEHALNEVFRIMDVDAAIRNLKLLMKKGNVHIHTDLIAGLPYEGLDSFKESFNRVYEVGAHHLQLGFLKLLRGTRIRREAQKHGYKYRDYPPYEVIENQYLSSMDLLVLKGVEEVLDRTYNSGRFNYTLDYLISFFGSPFELYEQMAVFFKECDVLYQPMSAANIFKLTREFALRFSDIDKIELDTVIAVDYACSVRNTVLPEFMADSSVKALDSKELLEGTLEEGWKKEYRKRFLVISGSVPEKLKEDLLSSGNRIVVDIEKLNPVTGRVVPKLF